MFQFPFFFFPPPSDAVMAESETPKVTTPIARTSRRARLRNWLWLFSFCFLNLISYLLYLWKYFLSVMKYYTCWFLFYFHSFNIGTWHQSKLGMMMCKDTKSSRLLINLVLFFIKKERKKTSLSQFYSSAQMCEGLWVRWVMSSKFMASLQTALNVCLYHVWTAVFNGLPQLAQTVLLPTTITHGSLLHLPQLSFPFICCFQQFQVSVFLWWPHSSPVSVFCFLVTIAFYFFLLFCLTHLLLPSWPPLFSCNQSLL